MKTMLSFSWEDLADLLQDFAPSLAQGKMAARGVNALRRRSDLGELSSRALLEQILALVWVMQRDAGAWTHGLKRLRETAMIFGGAVLALSAIAAALQLLTAVHGLHVGA
jgi:hypothetical protein